jgi:hypothetical protein
VRVARSGSGAGSVLSSPSGISCGDECGASFNKGTPVILIATPDEDSSFSGWSGACSGSGSCAFTVLGDITATASFIPREVSGGVVQPSATSSAQATSTQVAGQETAAGQRGHVVITEIMAGREGSADYEFVELYNAGDAAVDLTGWSVKKKSSTGSESSLVVASRLEGKTILPRRHFLLVNDGGYDGAVPADVRWATSNTLAYTNNAVALYDGDGAKVEEIAWAEIPKGSSYERQMATGQFFIQSAPNPENSSSM